MADLLDVPECGCRDYLRPVCVLASASTSCPLPPVQIGIAKKVFSPDPGEVAFARKVIEAIPDGRSVHMIDGKNAGRRDPEAMPRHGGRRPH
jgi:hypothetical protein